MPTDAVTRSEFLSVLRAAISEAGGIRAFSRRVGVNAATVCQTVNARIDPPESVANAIGYVVETRYRRVT
jgi:hypothetical protein